MKVGTRVRTRDNHTGTIVGHSCVTGNPLVEIDGRTKDNGGETTSLASTIQDSRFKRKEGYGYWFYTPNQLTPLTLDKSCISAALVNMYGDG